MLSYTGAGLCHDISCPNLNEDVNTNIRWVDRWTSSLIGLRTVYNREELNMKIPFITVSWDSQVYEYFISSLSFETTREILLLFIKRIHLYFDETKSMSEERDAWIGSERGTRCSWKREPWWAVSPKMWLICIETDGTIGRRAKTRTRHPQLFYILTIFVKVNIKIWSKPNCGIEDGIEDGTVEFTIWNYTS